MAVAQELQQALELQQQAKELQHIQEVQQELQQELQQGGAQQGLQHGAAAATAAAAAAATAGSKASALPSSAPTTHALKPYIYRGKNATATGFRNVVALSGNISVLNTLPAQTRNVSRATNTESRASISAEIEAAIPPPVTPSSGMPATSGWVGGGVY
jgi:hypothetical protein